MPDFRDWWGTFCKFSGAGVLLGVVMYLASEHTTLFLSIFWGGIICGGLIVWWAEKRTK